MTRLSRLVAPFARRGSLLGGIASGALALFILWQAWDHFGPRKPELGPPLRQLADRVMPTAVAELREKRASLRSVALLHLENDPSDYVTEQLRAAIERNNVFDLPDTTLGYKIRNDLRLRHDSYGSPEPALAAAAARGGVQGVLFGTVHALDSDARGRTWIDLELQLADVAQKRVVFTGRYTGQSGGGGGSVGVSRNPTTDGGFRLDRLLAWVVVVLLLPVFTIAFIRAMVRRRSNGANVFTLGVYTTVDAALAYLLLGVALSWWLPTALFAAAIAAAVAYNASVMGFAHRLET